MISAVSATAAATAPPQTLVVTRTFLPNAGGIEDYVYSRCIQASTQVAVLSASCPGDRTFDQQQPFPIHRWPTLPLPPLKRVSALIKQILYMLWELIETLRLYARYRYTAIEWCHGYDFPILLLLTYLLPVRFTLYLHGNDLLCPLRNWLFRLLFQLTLNRMDNVVCNSHFTETSLKKQFEITAPTCVINPIVRPEKFEPLPTPDATADIRRRYGIPPTAIVLLSVGRLVPRKGFDTVIKLLPRLRETGLDIHYLICGKGSQLPDLQTLVAQLALTDCVHFAGYVPDYQLAAHYTTCDIFTLPTFFDTSAQSIEGYGIVYAEAGYFGKPVVACNVGGVTDAVIHQENGLLVSPERPDEILEAIACLCQDAALRAQLGRQGQALAMGKTMPFDSLYSAQEKALPCH
jgi:glycosyltransferase involved in cell wall biosynthesis